MKKVSYALSVLMLILSVASLSSCKKDKKTTPLVKSTVTADIDGKATDFSSFAIVLTGSTNGNNFTAIQGDAADGCSISVSVYGTLTAGKTYTIDGSDFGTGPAIAYSTSNDDTYLPDENSSTTLSVTITAVSASSIQGSFKGELAYVGSGAKPGKSITNGKFNVQR